MALDNLTIFGVEYSGVTGFKAQNSQSSTMVYIRPEGTSAITANGTYDVAAFSAASVLVTPTLSTVTGVVPSTTSQTISTPTGYDGMSAVTVNAVPMAQLEDEWLTYGYETEDGSRIFGVAGYYSYGTGGYVSAGSYQAGGEVFPAVPTGTTITPTTTAQTIGGSNYMMEGPVTVNAIPSAYIIPTGTSNITSNGTYDIASYASVSVAVSGAGGYTIDQIAERLKISGWISGSASTINAFAFGSTYISRATFTNATKIAPFAFASCLYITTVTSTDFPSCSYIASNAFIGNTNLESVEFLSVQSIYSYAFYNCAVMETASFPNAGSIYASVFDMCVNLTSVYIPKVKYIGTCAFAHCSSLTFFDAPMGEVLSSAAFSNCKRLASISVPKLTKIESAAFYCCETLATFYGPSVTNVSSSIFYSCSALSVVSFPVLSIVASYAFRSLYALQSVSLSMAEDIGSYAFANCSALSEISLPAATKFGTNAFNGCWNLISFNLTGVSSVPYLPNSTNTFLSTPISTYSTVAGQFGSIYVPSSLYTAFTTANNWSAFSARMVSV